MSTKEFLFSCLMLTITTILLTCIVWTFSTCNSASVVMEQELSPKAINEKYNSFKETASQIQAQQENLKVLSDRNREFKEALGEDRKTQLRTDKEIFAQYQSELSGAVANYNRLVANYNAEMLKWHTKFANFGDLPVGWEKDVPPKFSTFDVK